MDATGDFIGIYGTHGNKSDTWITEWISVDIMYTPTTNSEEDLEEFTWDYSAEVKVRIVFDWKTQVRRIERHEKQKF